MHALLRLQCFPVHPPTQEATAVKLWRNAQWVSSEALAKEDTLRRVPPKTQQGPRLSSRGAPLRTEEKKEGIANPSSSVSLRFCLPTQVSGDLTNCFGAQ